MNNTVEEKYMKIDECNVLYYIVGKGPHVILFNEGILSHCIDQYEQHFQYYDLEKFTIVLWDPPGYGKNRPPEKDFTIDFYFENAEYAFKLMKAPNLTDSQFFSTTDSAACALNFNYYSVWGACSGGASSMILAAEHPEVVRALVLSNSRSHYLPNDVKLMMKMKNFSRESKSIQARLKVYGEDNYIKNVKTSLENLEVLLKERKGNVCSHLLSDIKCPTFIVAGGKDPLVDKSHASYLYENIQGSKLYVGPEYGHLPYLTHPAEFCNMVQEFILQH